MRNSLNTCCKSTCAQSLIICGAYLFGAEAMGAMILKNRTQARRATSKAALRYRIRTQAHTHNFGITSTSPVSRKYYKANYMHQVQQNISLPNEAEILKIYGGICLSSRLFICRKPSLLAGAPSVFCLPQGAQQYRQYRVLVPFYVRSVGGAGCMLSPFLVECIRYTALCNKNETHFCTHRRYHAHERIGAQLIPTGTRSHSLHIAQNLAWRVVVPCGSTQN